MKPRQPGADGACQVRGLRQWCQIRQVARSTPKDTVRIWDARAFRYHRQKRYYLQSHNLEVENMTLQQIEQSKLGARPWTDRILSVLRDQDGRLRREIRPRELPQLMNISVQKAATELSKLREYKRVVLTHGGVKYILQN